jgi:hypothetical protein
VRRMVFLSGTIATPCSVMLAMRLSAYPSSLVAFLVLLFLPLDLILVQK